MSLAKRVIRDDPASPVAVVGSDALAVRRASLVLLRRARGGGGLDDRRRFRVALVIALLAHVLLYLGLQSWTRLQFDVPEENEVIHLRLISPESDAVLLGSPDHAEPMAVMPVESKVDARGLAVSAAAPASTATVSSQASPVARDRPVVAGGPLNLLDRSGGALLPQQSTDDKASTFGPRARTDTYARDPMVHQSPLPYRATPFDRYWIPDDETLLDEWVRKASKQTTYDTVHGTRITCEVFLFLSACGWGPTPRVSIEELRAMRVSPPSPRNSAEDPYVQPQD